MGFEFDRAFTIPIVIRRSVFGPEGARGRANKGEHVGEHARARGQLRVRGMKRRMTLALTVGASLITDDRIMLLTCPRIGHVERLT